MEKAQREAYFDPFEKATGIKVISVTAPNPAKIKTGWYSLMEWTLLRTGRTSELFVCHTATDGLGPRPGANQRLTSAPASIHQPRN